VRASLRRLDVYDSLRPRFPTTPRAYFDAKPFLIKRGALYQGSLERFFRCYVSTAARLLRPRWVRRLFACTNHGEQRRLLPGWHSPFWRLVAKTICRRSFFNFFSHEPGFWRFLRPDSSCTSGPLEPSSAISTITWPVTTHCCGWCFRALRRRARDAEYLRADAFARIKRALQTVRLNVVNGDMASVLRAAPPQYFDGYSLSDISAYLPHELR